MGQPVAPPDSSWATTAPATEPEPDEDVDPSDQYGQYTYVYATPTSNGMGYWSEGDVEALLATVNRHVDQAGPDDWAEGLGAIYNVQSQDELMQVYVGWDPAGGGELEVSDDNGDVFDYANAEDTGIAPWRGAEEWQNAAQARADAVGGGAPAPPAPAPVTGG